VGSRHSLSIESLFSVTLLHAMLSFDDDEAEAEVFQVNKKKLGKKKSMRAPDADDGEPGGAGGAGAGGAGGEYSVDNLRKLANAQDSLRARPAEHVDPEQNLVELKMRGTLKPPGAPAPARDPSREVRPHPTLLPLPLSCARSFSIY